MDGVKDGKRVKVKARRGYLTGRRKKEIGGTELSPE